VNTGNLDLTNVTLNDDLLGPIALVGLTDEDGDGDFDDLAPGATATGTASTIVTQAQLDAGAAILNTATADSDETGPDTATESVGMVQNPALEIEKTADVAAVNAAGDQIVYSYEVENTGNVSLTDLTVDDDLLGAVALAGLSDTDGDGDFDDLAIGQTATGTITATVTQAEIDAGLDIVNTATADSDQTAPETAMESVTVNKDPALEVRKDADVDVVDAAGDQIVYSYEVENTGNSSLIDVTLDDDILGPVALVGLSDEDGDDDDLAVGATATGTLTETVSQAQIDSNLDIVNVASADADGVAPETATESVTIDQGPALTVTKTADVALVDAAGDAINYDYEIENTGNISLLNVDLSDDLLGPIALVGLTDEDGDLDADDLAVGATATGTATAIVTQAQINAGVPITNVATATTDQTGPDTATESVDVDADPGIEVLKTADVTHVDAAGDQIVYAFTATNTGAVTLTDVKLIDDLLGAVPLVGLTNEDGDGLADDLAVGASVTGTLTATVTQAEIDSGLDITNIATAASNQTGPETVTESVTINQAPQLSVTKAADTATVSADGEIINYDYTLENTGNLSLTNVVLNDDLLGPIALLGLTDEDGDGDDDDLAVGATATGAAAFTVTQAELDAGLDITNVATAESDESGPATAIESVSIEELPMFTLSKDADKTFVSTAGEFIVYEYIVENTGNVALTNVSLNDDLLGPVSLGGLTDEDGDGDVDDLAAGRTAIGQVTTTVTQAEINAGADIVNTATVTADGLNPEVAMETVNVNQSPSMVIDKSVDKLLVTAAGDVINYGFTVLNTGNIALTDVEVNDNQLGAVALSALTDEDGDGLADDLAVGAVATGSLSQTVSSADFAAGTPIVNVATVISNESAPENATQTVNVGAIELCCGITPFTRPELLTATQTGDALGNSLNGTNGNSIIFGLDGNDTLSGNGGSNALLGGAGDDILNGGNNADTMFGDTDDDILNGNAGDDQLNGGAGDDKLYGGGGDDDILAGSGDDLVEGGDGDDRICGGTGNDTIQGEGGDDCIAGGEDSGVISGSAGTGFSVAIGDTLFGNGGADRFEFNAGHGVDLLLGFNPNEGDQLVISSNTVYGDFAGIVFDNGAGGLEGVFFQQEQDPLTLQGFIANNIIDFI
jgi:uncharacterized repeat protein (TIGR01451 family)